MPAAIGPDQLLVMTGCCVGDMRLSMLDLASGTVTERFDIVAPVETLTVDRDVVIATDASGTLLVSDGGELRSLGTGYQAADR